jgi:hypothetical protein
MTIAEAIKVTDAAARAYSRALQTAPGLDWWSSADHAALKAATSITVGRVTVSAAVGGNSVAQHVRHTFKIDGKRASAAKCAAL